MQGIDDHASNAIVYEVEGREDLTCSSSFSSAGDIVKNLLTWLAAHVLTFKRESITWTRKSEKVNKQAETHGLFRQSRRRTQSIVQQLE